MSIGLSGTILVETVELDMSGGSVISTSATFNAGDIFITANSLRMTGEGTAIASEKGCCDDVPGEIGDINIVTNSARLSEGASITTNASTGEAGNISIQMGPDSILILEGKVLPASIQTSSGLGTGGKITIASPLAIISNGGSILAQGEFGGANVVIDTKYFITSADRPNVVAVDGSLSFTNSIYDVSSGTVDADLAPIDASGVLRGQCSAMRTIGSVSQLNLRPVGPFGSPVIAATQPSSAASAGGGCL